MAPPSCFADLASSRLESRQRTTPHPYHPHIVIADVGTPIQKALELSMSGTSPISEKEDWSASRDGRRVVGIFVGRSLAELKQRLFQKTELSSDDVRHVFKDMDNIGDALYQQAATHDTEELGKALERGLKLGALSYDKQREEFVMSPDNNDLTTLMWQVALTNWETTKKELSSAQVATMARISLQALGNAAFPGSVQNYDPVQVDKALEKAQTVIKELNTRMSQERGRLLAQDTSA